MSVLLLKCRLFDAVLKPKSAAELSRLVDVELLPECDPRLFDSVPGTSIYNGVKEFLKTAIAAAAQTSQELQKDSEKAVSRRKEHSKAADDSVPRHRADTAERRRREKNLVKSLPQKTPSSKSHTSLLNQSSSGSRRHRTAPRYTGGSSHSVVPVSSNLSFAAAWHRKEPRPGTSSKEHRSGRYVTKAHTSRKRKRKDFDDLMRYGDRFPSMGCLAYDEMAFSWHLPQLSFFAELDHNPDDPLLLISLCELDDIAAFQRQDFIHDLNSTYIGRKPRFGAVRSPYRDRTSHRLGQLSLQTYCGGHFIDCGLVNRVHMTCLHHWAAREPLEKIVHNIWKDNNKPAGVLPYPSVRCLSDVVCFWLSSQLCYLMSDVSIDCVEPSNIFIGSSLQSELTTNCLHQMFCRYVEFLCDRAEKYFMGVEVEPETYAAHGGMHASLWKHTLPSVRRKAPGKRMRKQSSTRQENVDHDYEGMPSELDKFVLLDDADADMEQAVSLHDKDMYSDDHVEEDTDYCDGKVSAPVAHKKRKLPEDDHNFYDGDQWTNNVPSKARKIHRDHTELLAQKKESDVGVCMKKHDRERARRKEAAAAKPKHVSSFLKHKDAADFVVNDADSNIVVQCSDTGRTVIEAKSQEVTAEDELKPDDMPISLNVPDKLPEPKCSPLYSIELDHCYYSSASVSSISLQPVASEVHDLGKEEHPIIVDDGESENVNPPTLPSHITLVELTDAGEKISAEVPSKDLDCEKSKLPLPQISSGEPQEKTEKAFGLVKELSSASDDRVPQSQAVAHEKSSIKPLSQKKMPSVQLDILSSSKPTDMSTTRKLHPLSSLTMLKTASVPEPEVNVKGLIESARLPVARKPIHRKKHVTPSQKVGKDVTGMQKRCDSGADSYQKSDDRQISLNEDSVSVTTLKKNVTVSYKDVSSNKDEPFSPPPRIPPKASGSSTVASKISVKKIRTKVENAKKVSEKVDGAPATITEQEKATADTCETCEAPSIPVDNDSEVADAEVPAESEKTAAKALLSAAELAATARAAAHYQDAYLSDMADAYDVWPLSNFDPAFDPTNVPEGHTYNPFRKTWPILQHVIDGKADLLLRVCSFPDVSLFSIRRVMRENGFLWAVCLSLFEPALSKPDSMDILMDPVAAGKTKSAKSSNPLMQAFRQAVEAKKKVAVAAKSKVAVRKQTFDDTGETQSWSTKRPAGKMSIVFGSAVKSGGSLSSVVGTDQSAKAALPANNFSNLLTSVVSNMNSDMSELILQKCGKQRLGKNAHSAEYKSTLLATSRHLNTLSDLSVNVYDRAEYKLEKMFAAKDAENQKSIEKSVEDSKPAAVIETPAAEIEKTAATVSVSSPASDVVKPSFVSDNTNKTSAAQITHVTGSLSDDVRSSVSAAAQVSQPSVPQPAAAKSASVPDLAAGGDSVGMTSAAVVLKSGNTAASVKAAGPAVADMLPPPLPPLSLSCIGPGFDSRSSEVTASASSEALTSWPSVSSANQPVNQPSTNPPHTAYQPTPVGFTFPPPVAGQPPPSASSSFSNASLPLDHLIRVPPPLIQPNLYSVPPPVGIPLNVPPPGFVGTSVPPPNVAVPPPPVACPPPPMPWFPPPSSSAAGGFPAVAAGSNTSLSVSGFQKTSEVPGSVASCADVALTPIGKALDSSSSVRNLQASSVVVTSSSVVSCTSMNSMAGPKPVVSPLIHGVRLRGPLKLVTPVSVSPPPGLACPAVRQVRPFPSTTSAEIIQVAPPQNTNSQLRVAVPGTRPTAQGTGILGAVPTAQAPGFPIVTHSNRVPIQPVTAGQNMHPNAGGPLVGQSPHGVMQSQLPPSAIRPVPPVNQPAQPNSQLRASGPLLGQSPRGIVHPGQPSVIQPTPLRGALPDSQPRGPVTPVLARTAGPVMGQSPHSANRPPVTGMPMSGQMPSALSAPRGLAVRAESRLPFSPAQPPVAVTCQPSQPLAAAGGTGTVQPARGPLLSPSSRVYVLNSGSSLMCRNVEVSV